MGLLGHFPIFDQTEQKVVLASFLPFLPETLIMKLRIDPSLPLLFLWLQLSCGSLVAQTFSTDNPADYNDFIVNEQNQVGKAMIGLMIQLVQTDDYEQNNKKRNEVVGLIDASLKRLNSMEPFRDDDELKSEAVAVFQKYRDIHTNSYAEITLLMNNRQSSVESLEHYFSLQNSVEQQLLVHGNRLVTAQRNFAKKHHLVLTPNSLQNQFDAILEVNKYSRDVFLKYFRVSKLDNQFITALTAEDATVMEANRVAMLEQSKSTLYDLNRMNGFDGDLNLRDVAIDLVKWHKGLGEQEYVELVYMMGKEDLTNPEIDRYNAIVTILNDNSRIDAFNKANRDLMVKVITADQ